jgi:hypothetical protein
MKFPDRAPARTIIDLRESNHGQQRQQDFRDS